MFQLKMFSSPVFLLNFIVLQRLGLPCSYVYVLKFDSIILLFVQQFQCKKSSNPNRQVILLAIKLCWFPLVFILSKKLVYPLKSQLNNEQNFWKVPPPPPPPPASYSPGPMFRILSKGFVNNLDILLNQQTKVEFYCHFSSSNLHQHK